jgi:PAS domain S-box-containing protein
MMDLFQDVIDGMAGGIAIFDADERLIGCNEKYRRLFPELTDEELLKSGTRYENLARVAARRGLVIGADEGIEEQVKQRLVRFRTPVSPFEVARSDGTWIRSTNKRTIDGRTICVREDITDARRAEQALREAEWHYRGILDDLTDMFLRADMDGRVVMVSPSVKSLFGYEPEEFIGRKLVELYVHPVDRENYLREIRERGRVTSHRTLVRRKDGREIWIATSGQYFYDTTGNVLGVQGTSRDVTNEYIARVALEESEARLSDAQRIARIGSWERNLHDGVLWWSDEVYRLFGLTPGAIEPTFEFLTESTHPDDRDRVVAATIRMRQQGGSYNIDHRIISPTGEVRWLNQQAELALDDAGNPIALHGTTHDISDRKHAEEKIGDLNAQLEARVAERTRELVESEARFEDFALLGAGWFWEMDSDHRFTWFSVDSPISRDMLGIRRWEVGDDYLELTDWSRIRAHLSNHEAFREVEVVIKGKNEAAAWISTSAKPMFDADGRYLGHRGVTRDVSDKRGFELALSVQRERFDNLIAVTSQGYWHCDADGRTLDLNPAMCEILGRSRKEVLGRFIYEFADADNRRVFDQQLDLRRRGVRGAYEIELLHSNGSSIACISNPTPIYSPAGEHLGSIGFWTDISKNKEIQASLEEANSVAQKANQAKTEFLSSMSHELRTPLNAILGFAQLLETDSTYPLVDDQMESVRQVLKGGTYLLGLIEEVLDLAKIEGGNVDLSIENVNVGSIVADCIDVLLPVATNAGITIESEIETGEETWILADRTRLKQILLNLLSNAIKYNSRNGRITIANTMVVQNVSEKSSQSMHRITVSDTGLGIPAQSHGLVFQPFDRLGREFGEIEGTGIGLSISKNLVELMGGRIGFESEDEQGTTFWIDLPISDTKGQVSLRQMDDNKWLDTVTKPDKSAQRTILYVEDNPANLSLMEKIVGRLPGFTLISAHTAELGLDIARQHVPEIIILDINLPGMDGYDALERLKRYEETRDIPVIAISSNAMPVSVRKGLDAGFLDYLTKPINISTLLEALENASNVDR